MKSKLSRFLVLLLALIAQLTFAQERTVSGIVTDDTSMPLPGVSVLVKGTKTGTQTDFD
ncbi:hypothetical protein [uncultured Flavobacterium sp.]|uniref:hypothetical protein n=1 Tax=uncultured Flavobacterium sp. TaxID=165435 RepID=UPI0034139BFE